MRIVSAADYPEITCVCRVTSLTGRCDTCGAIADDLHAPEVAHGFYCSEHCPCRTYRPSKEERRAMERNRQCSLDSKAIGKCLKPLRKVSARPVNPPRRAAALRQWSDPKARRKIIAGILRGHIRLRQLR